MTYFIVGARTRGQLIGVFQWPMPILVDGQYIMLILLIEKIISNFSEHFKIKLDIKIL